MNDTTIPLDKAIKHMRELTEKGIPFSFSFRSYNESKDVTRGDVYVSKAALRKKSDNILLLEYVDITQDKPKHCYECLLKTFNNKKIVP